MSQAEELLNSISTDDVSLYTINPDTEEHIIIGANRYISVPESLKRIAVQHDHNIETITFDCPRYWDENDLTKMNIWINYIRADRREGRYLAKNVRIDETDSNMIHFDWTIGNEISEVDGPIVFLVCALKTNSEGYEELHWNSEMNKDMFVSKGLECSEEILNQYPDIINDLLNRMDTIIAANGPLIDTSLSQAGLAADAKATGEAISNVDNRVTNIMHGSDYVPVEGNPIHLKEAARNSCNLTPVGVIDQEVIEGEAGTSVVGEEHIQATDVISTKEASLTPGANTTQETREGYNLLNISTLATQTKDGVMIILNKDLSITLDGTSTSNITIDTQLGTNITFETKSYIFSINNSTSENSMFAISLRNASNSAICTLDSGMKSTKFNPTTGPTAIYFRLYIPNGKTFNNFTFYPMMIEGTEEKPYEQYGAMPSINYPSPIKSVSGSYEFDVYATDIYFDNVFRQGGYNNASNNITKRVFSQNQFTVKSGKEYTVLTNLDLSIYQYVIGLSKTTFPVNTLISDSGWLSSNEYKFTSTSDAYFGIGLRRKDEGAITPSDFKNVKFLVVTTHQHLNLDLPEGIELCKLGDVSDKIDFDYIMDETGYKTIDRDSVMKVGNIGDIELNGTENWIYNSTNTGYRYYLQEDINLYAIGNDSTIPNLLCNMFKAVTMSNTWQGVTGISSQTSSSLGYSRLNFCYKSDETDTVEKWKSWLAKNTLKVKYPLAIQVATQITDETFISQLEALINIKPYEGITNISVTSSYDEVCLPLTEFLYNYVTAAPSTQRPSAALGLEGKCELQHWNQNYYDINDISIIDSGLTIEEDGWVNVNIDNRSGTALKYVNLYTNESNRLQENTKYYIVTEVMNVNTNAKTGNLCLVSSTSSGTQLSQFTDTVNLPLVDLKPGIYINECTTREDFSIGNVLYMLRSFFSVPAGNYFRAKVRISVLDHQVTAEEFLYSEFQNETINLDLPEGMNLFEGEKIFKEEGKWYRDKTYNKYVFTGNESIASYQYGVNSYSTTDVKDILSDENIKIITCNYFYGVSNADRNNNISDMIYSHNSYIYFRNTNFTSIDEFKAYLTKKHTAGNPLEIVYKLSNPTIEEITDEILLVQLNELTKLKTYKGVNNFFLTSAGASGLMKLEYRMFDIVSHEDLEKIEETIETDINDIKEDINDLQTKTEEEINNLDDKLNKSVPDGGVTGQALTKRSNANQDVGWTTLGIQATKLYDDFTAAEVKTVTLQNGEYWSKYRILFFLYRSPVTYGWYAIPCGEVEENIDGSKIYQSPNIDQKDGSDGDTGVKSNIKIQFVNHNTLTARNGRYGYADAWLCKIYGIK